MINILCLTLNIFTALATGERTGNDAMLAHGITCYAHVDWTRSDERVHSCDDSTEVHVPDRVCVC